MIHLKARGNCISKPKNPAYSTDPAISLSQIAAGGQRPSGGGKVDSASQQVKMANRSNNQAVHSQTRSKQRSRRDLENIERFEAHVIHSGSAPRIPSSSKVTSSAVHSNKSQTKITSTSKNLSLKGKPRRRDFEDFEQFEARALPPRVPPSFTVNRPTGIKGKGRREYTEIEELD